MGKDNVPGSASGGSRAAKKRRKQKGKVVTVVERPKATQQTSLNKNISTDGAARVKAGSTMVMPHPHSDDDAGKRIISSKLLGLDDSSIAVEGRQNLEDGAAGSKRKRAAHTSSSPSYSREASAGARGDSSGGGGGGSSGGGSSNSSSSRRGQTAGGEEPVPKPVVIDASAADDRSRLLLELDAEGVLSDSDVESGLKARQLLQWMVAPLPVEEFYSSFWRVSHVILKYTTSTSMYSINSVDVISTIIIR